MALQIPGYMNYHIKINWIILPQRCFDNKKCSDRPDTFKYSRINWSEDEADVTVGILLTLYMYVLQSIFPMNERKQYQLKLF